MSCEYTLHHCLQTLIHMIKFLIFNINHKIGIKVFHFFKICKYFALNILYLFSYHLHSMKKIIMQTSTIQLYDQISLVITVVIY